MPWDDALQAVVDRLDGESVSWFLGCSEALAVRGINVQPGDLDLIITGEDAGRIKQVFQDALVQPVIHSPGWLWSWFSRVFLYGQV